MSEICGCCEGIEIITPTAVTNRPGLNALAYRAGTFSTFLETMKARLSSADYPALAALATRDADDPAIALLDAWAAAADVLTFYQERIANEGFLRTATERRSILALARLVGYTLRPGVSATVFLAYSLQKDSQVDISVGTRAQSVPGPGELPQSYETAEVLPARDTWNSLAPRQTRPQIVQPDTSVLYLDGLVTNLRPNDPILFVFPDQQVLQRVQTVEAQAKDNRTKITLQNATPAAPAALALSGGTITPATPFEKLLTMVQPLLKDPASHPRNSLQLARDIHQTFSPDSDTAPALLAALHPRLETQLYNAFENAAVAGAPSAQVFALRTSAAPFGSNAPLKPVLDERGAAIGTEEWPLAGSVVLTVSIPPPFSASGVNIANLPARQAGAFLPQQGVIISIRQDPAVDSVTLPAPVSGPVAVGSHTVKLDITDKSAGFDFSDLAHTITITHDPAKGSIVGVKIDADAVRQIGLGQSIRLSANGRRISIVFTFTSVTVTYESPLAPDSKLLPLDAAYDQMVPGGWAVIERPDRAQPIITQIGKVQKIAKANYGISGRVTQLTLNVPWLDPNDLLLSVARNVNVSAQSEELKLAEEPIEDPVCGNGIELDGLYAGLESGRWLIVEGERTDIPLTTGVKAAELVMLAAVQQGMQKTVPTPAAAATDLPGDSVHSFLQLAKDLAYCYRRDTLVIHGNVVRATHGETRSEVLGSGDGGQELQQFTLHQSPLTFLAAPSAAGSESALQVRVNGIAWHEADSLAGLGPDDRSFLTQTGDDDKTTIIFGNGRSGARLPSGTENVKAVYRNGIGEPGNVAAGRISLLATRPLGVKDVINPLPATGGADRESRDQARDNAPLGVTALDRLVSVQDYADFARTFAGIGESSALRISDGNRQVVHLTIAGAGDIPIDTTSDLYLNLNEALFQLGDPHQPLQVGIRGLLLIVIAANVQLLQDFEWESVAPKIRLALLDSLSFERRNLGEDVFLSQVIAAVQAIEGVAYVDVDMLETIGENFTDEDLKRLAEHAQPKTRIPVKLARVDPAAPAGDRRILPAQIAYLSPKVPDTLILRELKP